MNPTPRPPDLDSTYFSPGMRVAVACSGGADSVALLRLLIDRKNTLGLVLSVAHLHHGIRGQEANRDAEFVAALASRFDLPLHLRQVDTPASAAAGRQGLEEAARALRYAWFRQLLLDNEADAIATAHTLDDQAETVLHRLFRGAWTEGLSAIHPRLVEEGGVIVRPFLAVQRADIEGWLNSIGQPWCEDSTNCDPAFTRNRIRHELLPLLSGFNPQCRQQLARVAAIARDEESYWQVELARLLPGLLLPGKAVRGGGRATSTVPGTKYVSVEIERLRPLHPALRRRVLRAAAAHIGGMVGFEDTERLLALCGLDPGQAIPTSRPGARLELENRLRAERTSREIKLSRTETAPGSPRPSPFAPEYVLPIPGQLEALEYALRLTASIPGRPDLAFPDALLRSAQPGDRVQLRHRRSPIKVKEVLERIALTQRETLPFDPDRWPLLVWQGEIIWMWGVEVESEAARAAVLQMTSVPIEAAPGPGAIPPGSAVPDP